MNTPQHLTALTGRIIKSRLANGPVESILTYPLHDIAGDYVRPDGGIWTPFEEYPVINWTHKIPIGHGAVSIKSLNWKNETHPVAVGESIFFKSMNDLDGVDRTKFDDPRTRRKVGTYSIQECLDTARQCEQLIRDDIATGVSIEFTPIGQEGIDYWSLNTKSLLDNRDAYHYERWHGHGYAHARTPVNPGCRTLLADGNDTICKAYEIARTGKLLTGERCHPLVLKSFTDDSALMSRPRSVSVRIDTPSRNGQVVKAVNPTKHSNSAQEATEKALSLHSESERWGRLAGLRTSALRAQSHARSVPVRDGKSVVFSNNARQAAIEHHDMSAETHDREYERALTEGNDRLAGLHKDAAEAHRTAKAHHHAHGYIHGGSSETLPHDTPEGVVADHMEERGGYDTGDVHRLRKSLDELDSQHSVKNRVPSLSHNGHTPLSQRNGKAFGESKKSHGEMSAEEHSREAHEVTSSIPKTGGEHDIVHHHSQLALDASERGDSAEASERHLRARNYHESAYRSFGPHLHRERREHYEAAKAHNRAYESHGERFAGMENKSVDDEKNKWISGKIEKIMKEGVRGKPVKDNKQAYAIAHSMWEKRGKKTKAMDLEGSKREAHAESEWAHSLTHGHFDQHHHPNADVISHVSDRARTESESGNHERAQSFHKGASDYLRRAADLELNHDHSESLHAAANQHEKAGELHRTLHEAESHMQKHGLSPDTHLGIVADHMEESGKKHAEHLRSISGGFEGKSFDDIDQEYQGEEDPIDDEMIMVPDDTAGRGQPSAGVRALLNAAQFMMDGCASLEEDGSQSDDIETRQYIGKTCLMLKQMASDCIAQAEALKEKLDQATMGLGAESSTEMGGEEMVDEEEVSPEEEEEITDEEEAPVDEEGGEQTGGDEEEEAEQEEEKPEATDDSEESEEANLDREEEDEEESNPKKKKQNKSLDDSGLPLVDPQGYLVLKSFPELEAMDWKPRRFRREDLTPIASTTNKSLEQQELTPEETRLVEEYQELMNRKDQASQLAQQLLDIRDRDRN